MVFSIDEHVNVKSDYIVTSSTVLEIYVVYVVDCNFIKRIDLDSTTDNW